MKKHKLMLKFILKYANYIGEHRLSQTDLTSFLLSDDAFRLLRLFEYRIWETEISILPVKTDFYILRKKSKSDPWSFYDQIFLRPENISDVPANFLLPDDAISNQTNQIPLPDNIEEIVRSEKENQLIQKILLGIGINKEFEIAIFYMMIVI